jgi:4-hydroxybenzoyl-CoA reductase subunit alpha
MDTFVKISDDGNVTVITPAVEIGQGSHTVVAQITAEVLGIEMEKVRVISGDTEVTPYDLGVFGSRLVFLPAMRQNLRQKMLERKSQK